MELNLISMGRAERWKLYQVADDLGLFHELPPQPRPLAEPLVHLYQLGGQKQLWPQLRAGDPSLSEEQKRACWYAWHVWRERTDIWEMPNWAEDMKYDPSWMQDGTWFPLLYNQFISAFELERYIVNPWVRASAWITTVNQLDIPVVPKFDMDNPATMKARQSVKGTRVSGHFHGYVNEITRWWAEQHGGGRFEPVKELYLARTGFVSVALRDEKRSPQPDALVEGNWHNGVDNALVMNQKKQAFSWEEFKYRRDELEFVFPNVIAQMFAVGPMGASYGDGCGLRYGKSTQQLWSLERKLLNRLEKRVATARGFAAAIAEIAESKTL